jgi:hypothetical protein
VPLQNRVAPDGSLHAVAARGTMMGNRGGTFHRDDKTLGKRRWASTHWICCELEWKGKHHEPMGQGYTSLFFLDEVTALAAGHRPCFFCRRKEAVGFLGGERVEVFDRRLHEERLSPSSRSDEGEKFPDGTMVEINNRFYAKRGLRLLRWSFDGYTSAFSFNPDLRIKLLTPPSIIAILARGFQPRWHPSAQQWDET